MSEDRICRQCEQKYPLTEQYFRRRKHSYTNFCKNCLSMRAHGKPLKVWPPAPIGQKRCTKCKIAKPFSDFWGDRSAPDQHTAACKECQAVYKQQYYAEHREEEIRKRLEKIRANHDDFIAKHREYNDTHKEQLRADRHARRARLRSAEGTITAQDIEAQYKRQKKKCYYCHSKIKGTYHMDHVIPLSKGGRNSPENIVVACPACNRSKHAKLPHEWPEGGRLL